MNYNKEIAEFMGGSIINTETYESSHGSNSTGTIEYWNIPLDLPVYLHKTAEIGIFYYHNDWNCLMPVIERIEMISDFHFVLYKNTCTVNGIISEEKNKITAAYNAVSKIIEIYNFI